jgi:hypothetical protein
MSAVAAQSACRRCGTALAPSQEYCLGCGLRRPGEGRFGTAPVEGRPVWPRVLALACVAAAGAGLAVYLTRDPTGPLVVETATGGSVTMEAPVERSPKALTTWKAGDEGWTIVLVSVPKVQGRPAAVDVASAARARGLQRVGVLDSSRFASLHPGYWLVFSDRYETEAEATSALMRARTFTKSARVQRVAG